MEKSIEKESLNGQMDQNMMWIFMIITFKEKEFRHGKMVENIMVIVSKQNAWKRSVNLDRRKKVRR